MRYNYTDVIAKMILKRRFPERGEQLWLLARFVDYVFFSLGYNFYNCICPFCGKKVRSLCRHLLHPNCKCADMFRTMVKDITATYYELRGLVGRVKRRGVNGVYYCRVCGYRDVEYNVLVHVYEKHMKHMIIPVG